MSTVTRTAEQVLQQEFLQARARILDLAATFDRIAQATGKVAGSPHMELLRRGIDILRDPTAEKTKQVQLLFSREYDPGWRKSMDV